MPASPAHRPTPEEFAQLAATAQRVPVWRRLVSDSLTPVSAFHRLEAGGEGSVSCLFESVIGGEKVGRYSFLATNPYLLLEAHETRVTRTEFGPDGPSATTFDAEDPLQTLREEVGQVRVAKPDGLPPFVGGAIGCIVSSATKPPTPLFLIV